ncbi:DUF302 domain-containing protein [Thiocystis violacea]|uniref:DUF302 domain-containing protein n=1 Tax=Thiocystis violacea TaxID=13725 RepID=UPI001906D71C|nr:DUF302 domain-containing protein [Thiocystis violacea]MBK1722506.1 DUF302 domain-containing protein [Thiocystis violacea]
MASYTRPLLMLALIGGILSSAAADDSGYVTYRSEASFEDVFFGLRSAIEERGLYINSVMDIGGMLERTGKDLGLEGRTYTQARSIELCSAVLAREMTNENPARIVNCPFIISVYQRADAPGVTYVAHREIPPEERAGSPAMTKVAAMLQSLAEAALSW